MATRKKATRKKAIRKKTAGKKSARKRQSAEALRKRELRSELIEEHKRSVSGRPTDYDPDLAELILDQLAEGKSLLRICEAEGMPHRVTVMRWSRGDQEAAKADGFCNKYTRAREDGLRCRADEILEIADESSVDTKTIVGRDGNEREVVDHEAIQRSKLRCDVRQWEIARLLGPYRDKQEVQHSGGVMVVPATQSDEEWESRHGKTD